MSAFPRSDLARMVASMASKGIYVGTSSWKYQGWLGLLYTRERYMTRGKFSRARFEATCLSEYAETFKTVCADSGYYQFPTPKMLDGYFSQVPPDFKFSFKVTEDITVKQFPNLARYGKRAGIVNENFLNADLFAESFLEPLMPYRSQIGTLFFEFSPFHARDWQRGREFVAHLDAFLDRLPKGWDYSVEIRNESFLHPDYFKALRVNGVAHAYNSWSRMPPVSEQMRMIGSETADFIAARFLLKPGRVYEQAVTKFQPYSEVKEIYEEARLALAQLLVPTGSSKRRFLYVNNRLEGCSLWTIYAVLSIILAEKNPEKATIARSPLTLESL